MGRLIASSAAGAVVLFVGLSWYGFAENGHLRHELTDAHQQSQIALRQIEKDKAADQKIRFVMKRDIRHLRSHYLGALKESTQARAEKQAAQASLASEVDRIQRETASHTVPMFRETETQKKELERLKNELAKLRQENTAAAAKAKSDESELAKTRQTASDLLDRLKRYENREADYQKALKDYQNALQDAQKAESALQSANSRVTALKREAAVAHYNLGVLYAQGARYQDAAKEFGLALAIDPNDALAHFNLALLEDAYLQDPQSALNHYEAYLRLTPTAEDAKKVEYRVFQLRLVKNYGLAPAETRMKKD